MESRLNSTMKRKYSFIEAKQNFQKFVAENKDEVFCNQASKSYCSALDVAMFNFKSKKASEKDVEILEDFFKRIQLANKALDVKDSNGNPYPVNYFVYMPIPLNNVCFCLDRFRRCGFVKGENADVVQEFFDKVYPNHGYFTRSIHNAGEGMNLDTLLQTHFKIVRRRGNGELISKVLDVAEKYNLPKSSNCLFLVAYEFSRGREKVVDLGTQKMPNNSEKTKD